VLGIRSKTTNECVKRTTEESRKVESIQLLRFSRPLHGLCTNKALFDPTDESVATFIHPLRGLGHVAGWLCLARNRRPAVYLTE
jgi:hypothetical protein